MSNLEKQEKIIKEKLKALLKIIDLMEKKSEEERNTIANSEKKIDALIKLTNKIEDEVKKKKTDIIR